jgi:hypothetical protein
MAESTSLPAEEGEQCRHGRLRLAQICTSELHFLIKRIYYYCEDTNFTQPLQQQDVKGKQGCIQPRKKREIENKDPFVVMEHLQQQCSNHQ